MKKIIPYLPALLLAATLVTGCSKSNNDNDPAPTPAKGVFATGYQVKSGKYYATLWKDGTPTVFDSLNTTAKKVFVSGSDVYIAGQKNSKALLWKNGVATTLPTDAIYGYTTASSIYVNGTDVHIAGFVENATTYQKLAAYWKNNQPVLLNTGAGTENSYAEAVFVNGNDVYITGYRAKTNGETAVFVWKNGTATDLISSATASYANVQLYISGNDVYVACYDYEPPSTEQIRIWKNGMPVSFPVSVLGAVPYCLYVNGADIYVGGFERGGTPFNTNAEAKYWKNGVPVTLGSPTANSNDKVYSIYMNGTDLYVAGVLKNTTTGFNSARIWKNGVETILIDGTTANGEVYSVFAK